jgi:site-specific DNA-methyltransferase (adenine-specific)
MLIRKLAPDIPISIKDSLLIHGDALRALRLLPDESVQCVVTSPPYWGLRDYAKKGQIGSEENLTEYLARLVAVFTEVKRVLRLDGTAWLNCGDSYTSGQRKYRAPDPKYPARAMQWRPQTPTGLKSKEIIGVPWRLALALQDAGWYLRTDVVWEKPNAMPESVKDRPSRSHEYLFMLTKSASYYYDYSASREEVNGKVRNQRTVWSIRTQPLADAHFATFPERLVERCIGVSTKPKDMVLDPFFGSGTVGIVCNSMKRRFVGIEINNKYINIAVRRMKDRGQKCARSAV